MNVLINGLLTGLFLQLAIGPVFFFISRIALQSNFSNALAGILAVTLVDYIYIALSILGLGKIMENEKAKKISGIIGSVALMIFGTSILIHAFAVRESANDPTGTIITPLGSFVSCFILTLSSPLTIVFWSSIFTTKVLENGYDKKQVMVFGLGSGASTFIFLATAMFILSLVRSGIPDMVVSWLNVVVGALLVAYGVKRTAQTLVPRMASRS
jgi:threonine/homoserine/homoserine lactone efflux protein